MEAAYQSQGNGGGGGGGESSVVDHMDACMFGLSGCCKPNLSKQSHFPVSITSFLPLLFKATLFPPPSALASFLSPFFSLAVSQSQ